MGLFRRTRPYSRSECLEAAAKARAKGRTKRAVRRYREILAHDRHDVEIHAKIAPLLACVRELDHAWFSFEAAAQGYIDRGFDDKAIGIYRSAARYFPREFLVWDRLADLQLRRERRSDAVHTLKEGSRHLHKRRYRDKAIKLLRRAGELAPSDFEVSFDLARLLAREGKRPEAQTLLAELEIATAGPRLRRIRAAQFRLSPTPAAAWRWLRA